MIDENVPLTLDCSCSRPIAKVIIPVNFTKTSHDSLRVQYNNTFRHPMGLKRHSSASGMFTEVRISTFNVIESRRITSFLERLEQSHNSLFR